MGTIVPAERGLRIGWNADVGLRFLT